MISAQWDVSSSAERCAKQHAVALSGGIIARSSAVSVSRSTSDCLSMTPGPGQGGAGLRVPRSSCCATALGNIARYATSWQPVNVPRGEHVCSKGCYRTGVIRKCSQRHVLWSAWSTEVVHVFLSLIRGSARLPSEHEVTRSLCVGFAVRLQTFRRSFATNVRSV